MLTGHNNRLTSNERIAFVATSASAIRSMIDYVAYGIQAACARTWIDTAFVDTGFDIRTIRVRSTFWSTIWRVSIVVRQTFAHSDTILIIALGKLTTRRWYARIGDGHGGITRDS